MFQYFIVWKSDFIVKALVWTQENCAGPLTCTIKAETGQGRYLIFTILTIHWQFKKTLKKKKNSNFDDSKSKNICFVEFGVINHFYIVELHFLKQVKLLWIHGLWVFPF